MPMASSKPISTIDEILRTLNLPRWRNSPPGSADSLRHHDRGRERGGRLDRADHQFSPPALTWLDVDDVFLLLQCEYAGLMAGPGIDAPRCKLLNKRRQATTSAASAASTNASSTKPAPPAPGQLARKSLSPVLDDPAREWEPQPRLNANGKSGRICPRSRPTTARRNPGGEQGGCLERLGWTPRQASTSGALRLRVPDIFSRRSPGRERRGASAARRASPSTRRRLRARAPPQALGFWRAAPPRFEARASHGALITPAVGPPGQRVDRPRSAARRPRPPGVDRPPGPIRQLQRAEAAVEIVRLQAGLLPPGLAQHQVGEHLELEVGKNRRFHRGSVGPPPIAGSQCSKCRAKTDAINPPAGSTRRAQLSFAGLERRSWPGTARPSDPDARRGPRPLRRFWGQLARPAARPDR